MDYRQLGDSGFKVPALSLGTGTFGGATDFFAAWGSTNADGARRLVDICLEAGINKQLRANLGAVGWALTAEQVKTLDDASAVTLPYPYWHQNGFRERNPAPV
ncbi:MAG: hypothetical protein ABIR54_24360 [Burkholderiaceae bacterium]